MSHHQKNWLKDYRLYVTGGHTGRYDIIGAIQFNLLTHLGLREDHFLLDVGCGSLRAGRLFIPYLLPGHYFGIEPHQWLIDEAVKNEIGKDIIRIKQPQFSNDSNFTLSMFNRKFDYILAHSIFTHAPQQHIRRCLSEAKKVMKTTSFFVATFSRGKENYTGNKWHFEERGKYIGCVTYTLERMTSLAEEQGLVLAPIGWSHPNKQTWILIRLPKRGNDG